MARHIVVPPLLTKHHSPSRTVGTWTDNKQQKQIQQRQPNVNLLRVSRKRRKLQLQLLLLLLILIQLNLTTTSTISHESVLLVSAFQLTTSLVTPHHHSITSVLLRRKALMPPTVSATANTVFAKITRNSARVTSSTTSCITRSKPLTTTTTLHTSFSPPQSSLFRQHHNRRLFLSAAISDISELSPSSRILFGINLHRSSLRPLSSSSLGAVSPSSSSSTELTTNTNTPTSSNYKSSTAESDTASHPFSKSNQERLKDLMPSYNSDGQPYTSYEKCVRRIYLTNLFHPVKLGLQNMEDLHEALGNPMGDPNKTIIHIAGTNGKGSVALKIARTLENAGHRVGLFVSPHISSFRERMQINSQPITEHEVQTHLPHIYTLCESGGIPATFFEITTALAFRYFDKGGVDVVVLETGLGGRLDATNVLVRPDLCVVTSIGLEHTRILGDTVEEIAGEKAGIMKSGVPVLVGPNVPHDVMRMHANNKGVEGYYECRDVLGPVTKSSTREVDGVEYVDYDVENSQIATAALHLLQKKQREAQVDSTPMGQGSKRLYPITDANIEEGVSLRPPCRFEVMTCYYTTTSDSIAIKTPTPTIATIDNNTSSATPKPVTVILDVAHNPPAMDLLANKLKATYPNQVKRIVAGFSADKDLSQCAHSLLTIVPNPSNLHLVEAAHPRAARLEDMLQAEPKLKESNFDEKDRSIAAQVRSAMRLACERGEILIICGSVFIMSEVRETLGIEEPRDSKYIAEVAGSGMKNGQENFGDKDPEEVVVVT